MSQPSKSHLSNRVLKLNVGFLFGENSALTHNSELDVPRVRVADDLILNHLKGTIHLSRTKEGILLQTTLTASMDDNCFRCLEDIDHVMELNIQELYGFHDSEDTEFHIDEDGILDLTPLIRSEVFIEQSYCKPCRLNDSGKCGYCDKTFAEVTGYEQEERLDPRFAVLKKLLDSQ